MPADDVVKASFSVTRRQQTVATPTTVRLDAVTNGIERSQPGVRRTSEFQNVKSPATAVRRVCVRDLPTVERGRHLPRSASADVVDGWAVRVPSNLKNADGRPAVMVDGCQSSPDSTVRLESGNVGSGTDDPDWLTVRRQYLDNQVLRRQLRCQRADEIVSEQFAVVLRK